MKKKYKMKQSIDRSIDCLLYWYRFFLFFFYNDTIVTDIADFDDVYGAFHLFILHCFFLFSQYNSFWISFCNDGYFENNNNNTTTKTSKYKFVASLLNLINFISTTICPLTMQTVVDDIELYDWHKCLKSSCNIIQW